MNEFEWLRQMRELRQPMAPPERLWHAIDASLDDADRPASATPKTARRRLMAAALAASLLLAGGLAWRMHLPAVGDTPAPLAQADGAWKPDDPRLSGAAIELDAARMELQLAIQQSPDSPALQRLLDRTRQQQAQLRQLAHQAS